MSSEVHSEATVQATTFYNGEGIPWARPVQFAPRISDDPLLLKNESRGAAWIDIVLFIVLLFVADIAFGTVVRAVSVWRMGFGPEEASANEVAIDKAMLFPVLVLRSLSSFFLIWFIIGHRGQTFPAVGLTRRSIGVDMLLGVAALCAVYGLGIPFIWLIVTAFPQVMEQFKGNEENLQQVIPKLHPLAFVPMTMLIGFYEELIFRGFLLPRLRRGAESWVVATLLSTLLFALPHMKDQTWPAIVAISVLGILFSGLTIWRRSLWPGITAHFLFDLSQLLLLYFTAGDRWK